ncbi:MAG: thioredoxin domain-containing protein, partial [Dehalococcoidia bacterium]
EDHDTALLMNEGFINIKVDREERPDVDAIYMDAVQAMTSSGGWPLTVFLTPEGKPFYGGTYFPPEDRHGMPGFRRVLRSVVDFYRRNRGEVEHSARQIVAALEARAGVPGDADELDADTLNSAFLTLRPDLDAVNGGFGTAPKFPQPLTLEFLLRYHHRTGNQEALDMATLALEKMAVGGIYDQIGGGFHRYATDAGWLVPHFEKMLYDNALLSRVYLHAYLVTRRPLFRRIVEETIDYVLREMTGPEGGFYSAQDADSEGVEGKYYLWTLDEVKAVLGEEQTRVVEDYYGISARGNFEGRNILHVPGDVWVDKPEAISRADRALLEARQDRISPARDDKVLTSWNALMLASLAEAACVLERDDYLAAAVANGSFILEKMMLDGYLKHTYKDGEAKIEGFLDDYALAIDALLCLHGATFDGRWLSEAIRLADIMVDEFGDGSSGVLYDTSRRHEALLVRPRSTFDGAMPSGPSAAAVSLLKVSRLTGEDRLGDTAVESLKALQGRMSRHPLGFGNWLCALDLHLSPPGEIVIVGSREGAAKAGLLRSLWNTWLPNRVLAARDPADESSVCELELFRDRPMIDNKPTAYVCEGYSCRRPVTDADSLREQLRR